MSPTIKTDGKILGAMAKAIGDFLALHQTTMAGVIVAGLFLTVILTIINIYGLSKTGGNPTAREKKKTDVAVCLIVLAVISCSGGIYAALLSFIL